MKIAVDIRITERNGYETTDVALAKLEVEVPTDGFEGKKLQRTLDELLDDVTARVTDQLRAVQRQRETLLTVDE